MPTDTAKPGEGRKVVQLAVIAPTDDSVGAVVALCNDGTIWITDATSKFGATQIGAGWEPVDTPEGCIEAAPT